MTNFISIIFVVVIVGIDVKCCYHFANSATQVCVRKVRNKVAGTIGDAYLTYDRYVKTLSILVLEIQKFDYEYIKVSHEILMLWVTRILSKKESFNIRVTREISFQLYIKVVSSS